jgi:hypothetical protein
LVADIDSFDPVISRSVVIGDTEGCEQYENFASVAFLASVMNTETGRFTLIGRENSIEFYEQVWVGFLRDGFGTSPDVAAQRGFNADWRAATMNEATHDAYMRTLTEMSPPITISHKVAELFPTLRIWPRDPEYDVNSKREVQLRTEYGGLRLGGISLAR